MRNRERDLTRGSGSLYALSAIRSWLKTVLLLSGTVVAEEAEVAEILRLARQVLDLHFEHVRVLIDLLETGVHFLIDVNLKVLQQAHVRLISAE